ncbi:acylphosphatase [Candidatus Woesearchaeota archaeon]|nr:acylphosphatase [Candidatus Woesearchaeota archaeon]
MRRVHVWVSGNVQGVFFRAYTRMKAHELGIKGWVKNLPDDKVEAVFEGDDESIIMMIEFCKKGPEGATVTNVRVKEEKHTGEFDSFNILMY